MPALRLKDYRLENVYLRTTESQRSEILAWWRDAGAVLDSANDAEGRSHETVLMIRAPSGELAGVSGVALHPVNGGGRFYAYSNFLREQDRVPYLKIAVLDITRDFLGSFEHPVSKPNGMLIVTENPKLMRPGMRKLFARHGYEHWGRTAGGEVVWAVEFAEPDKTTATFSRRASGNIYAQDAVRLKSVIYGRQIMDLVAET